MEHTDIFKIKLSFKLHSVFAQIKGEKWILYNIIQLYAELKYVWPVIVKWIKWSDNLIFKEDKHLAVLIWNNELVALFVNFWLASCHPLFQLLLTIL